jgi:2-oxoisovalerate dehydrogenase E1 component alpha subunit
MEGTDEVVMTYFGDGSASQGDVNEAFNWAAAGSLPVLFFCQNYQWAISTPTSTQMRTPLHRRARGFGLHAYHVDGNDVLAVHAVTAAAAERIRSGGGPGLIEAETYRLGGHSSSDDPKRYRSEVDLEEWHYRDPLARMERLLRTEGGTSAEWFAELDAEVDDFAAKARTACKALTGGDLASLFDNVYAAPHAALAEEKRQFLAHQSQLEEASR